MKNFGQNLERIVDCNDHIKHISKRSMKLGDFIYVMTHNSVYKIRKAEGNHFEVSGGWFERQGYPPQKLTIRGCTWGGSIINISMVAACGLCLEFGNNVITSPVNKIMLIKANRMN